MRTGKIWRHTPCGEKSIGSDSHNHLDIQFHFVSRIMFGKTPNLVRFLFIVEMLVAGSAAMVEEDYNRNCKYSEVQQFRSLT